MAEKQNQDKKHLVDTITAEFPQVVIGVSSLDTLRKAPPSADPRYLMREAQSVITFALPVDEKKVDSFLSKQEWLAHGDDRQQVVRNVYRLSDRLVELLKQAGYRALGVDVNNNYRPEGDIEDVTRMTEFYPSFSHRYSAVLAGIG